MCVYSIQLNLATTNSQGPRPLQKKTNHDLRHTFRLLLVPVRAVVDGPEEAAVHRRLVQHQRIFLVVARVGRNSDNGVDASRQLAVKNPHGKSLDTEVASWALKRSY